MANHARAVSKFIKETGQIFPSQDSAIGYLAGLRGGNPSYSHLKNTSRALWWFLKFYGINLEIKNPKKPKTEVQEVLSVKEIGRIISRCGTRKEQALMRVMACAGIRTTELRNLKAKDVNFKKRTLFVRQGKNFCDRKVCITAECAKFLKFYLASERKLPEDFLFGGGKSKPLSLEYLRSMFDRLQKRANINKRLYVHLFRHSLATNLLLDGADILTVQRQLGHKDVRTTLAYINYTDKIFKRQYEKYMAKF